jgi:hypothetical protein
LWLATNVTSPEIGIVVIEFINPPAGYLDFIRYYLKIAFEFSIEVKECDNKIAYKPEYKNNLFRDEEKLESDTEEIVVNIPEKKQLGVYLEGNSLLKIFTKDIFTVFPNEELIYPWIYQHFINLTAYEKSFYNNELWCIRFVEDNWLTGLFDSYDLNYDILDKNKNIVEFIEKHINLGYYIQLWMDESYLLIDGIPKKKSHHVHPSLIYGYDRTNYNVYALANVGNGIVSKVTYSYKDLKKAFLWGMAYCRYFGNRNGMINLLRPKSYKEAHVFDLRKFTYDLHSYTYSIIDNVQYSLTQNAMIVIANAQECCSFIFPDSNLI